MRASEGIKFRCRSGVGTTSAEVKGRLRHVVSFSFTQSELLKIPAHHLNSKKNKRIHIASVYEGAVVDLAISISIQD